jgi:hypothetical protein
VLTIPGSVCWSVFLAQFVTYWLPYPIRYLVENELVMSAAVMFWVIAIPTAIYSTFHYFHERKTWYVIICLIVNVAGILFTVGILLVALVRFFTIN